MSIPSVNATGRITAPIPDTPSPTSSARETVTKRAYELEIDAATQLPVPPRFPWLSRLSQQLEAATRRRPSFQAAPVLGDHLNKSA